MMKYFFMMGIIFATTITASSLFLITPEERNEYRSYLNPTKIYYEGRIATAITLSHMQRITEIVKKENISRDKGLLCAYINVQKWITENTGRNDWLHEQAVKWWSRCNESGLDDLLYEKLKCIQQAGNQWQKDQCFMGFLNTRQYHMEQFTAEKLKLEQCNQIIYGKSDFSPGATRKSLMQFDQWSEQMTDFSPHIPYTDALITFFKNNQHLEPSHWYQVYVLMNELMYLQNLVIHLKFCCLLPHDQLPQIQPISSIPLPQAQLNAANNNVYNTKICPTSCKCIPSGFIDFEYVKTLSQLISYWRPVENKETYVDILNILMREFSRGVNDGYDHNKGIMNAYKLLISRIKAKIETFKYYENPEEEKIEIILTQAGINKEARDGIIKSLRNGWMERLCASLRDNGCTESQIILVQAELQTHNNVSSREISEQRIKNIIKTTSVEADPYINPAFLTYQSILASIYKDEGTMENFLNILASKHHDFFTDTLREKIIIIFNDLLVNKGKLDSLSWNDHTIVCKKNQMVPLSPHYQTWTLVKTLIDLHIKDVEERLNGKWADSILGA